VGSSTRDREPPDPGSADEDGSLAEAFWEVARMLRHRSRESLAGWQVAPSQFRALGVLLRSGPMRLRDLSEQLHIAPRSTTEVVDLLQERGLVERRPDPGDRRSTIVAPTAEGRRIGGAISASRAAEGDRVFGALSDTDRAELRRLLRAVRDGAAERSAPGDAGADDSRA